MARRILTKNTDCTVDGFNRSLTYLRADKCTRCLGLHVHNGQPRTCLTSPQYSQMIGNACIGTVVNAVTGAKVSNLPRFCDLCPQYCAGCDPREEANDACVPSQYVLRVRAISTEDEIVS